MCGWNPAAGSVWQPAHKGPGPPRRTALHAAACEATPEFVRMLLAAGADPTIRDHEGYTPLDFAWFEQQDAEQGTYEEEEKQAASCVALLEAALVCEPERPRLLLRARDLLDAARTIRYIQSGGDDGQRQQEAAAAPLRKRTRAESHRKALAAAPAYLKGRVAGAQELPRVDLVVEGEEEDDEELVGCLKYALGVEGGGGVHEGEGPRPHGMVKEVFVELCELLAPTWARKDM